MLKTFLLTVTLLLGQLAPAPASKGSIEGVVLGPTNQPVAGAEVIAFWEPQPMAYKPDTLPRAVTDADGRFRIADLDPMGYRVSVNATGFVFQAYGAAPGRANTGTVVPVASGQAVQGISLRLTKDNIISGRVALLTGEPLLRMQVRAVRRVFDETGWAYLTTEATAETNDRGEYRIPGLAEGRYYIRASAPFRSLIEGEDRRAQIDGKPVPPKPTPGLFAPMFYPYSPDTAHALAVDVKAGIEVRNVDIALSNRRSFHVSGQITDPEGGDPSVKLSVLTFPAGEEFPTSISGYPVDRDGHFDIEGVTPGSYWITGQVERRLTPEQQQRMFTPGVTEVEMPPPPPRGITLVKVVDSDVSNVQVTIVREPTIKGQFTIENETEPAPSATFRVEFRPVDPSGHPGPPVGLYLAGSHGTFGYEGLSAYEYRVTTSRIPPELYVKEAKMGNLDVLTQPFQLKSQPTEPLNILLARGGVVRGKVTDAGGRVITGQQVVLIPDRQSDRKDLYKIATTAADGSFTISGVAPGDYRVFAWRTMERFAYFDPDFVRQFEDKGLNVRVTESAGASLDVKLIP